MSNTTKLAILGAAIVASYCLSNLVITYDTVARWQAEALNSYNNAIAAFNSWQTSVYPDDLEPWVMAKTYAVALGCEGSKQLLGTAMGIWLAPIFLAIKERSGHEKNTEPRRRLGVNKGNGTRSSGDNVGDV
jgi:hypothetical protein